MSPKSKHASDPQVVAEQTVVQSPSTTFFRTTGFRSHDSAQVQAVAEEAEEVAEARAANAAPEPPLAVFPASPSVIAPHGSQPARTASAKPMVRPLSFGVHSRNVAQSRTSPSANRGSKGSLTHAMADTIIDTASAARRDLAAGKDALIHRLARLTAYWAGEGDYYTGRRVSSTGIHLHEGHCAVDPSIIPYGSVVEIPGVGQFLAVDTGSAVVHRTAAREAGHNRAERGALVIDLFFEHRREGERFAALNPKFVSINWWTPSSTGDDARAARSSFADEDWNMIYNKQL